MEKKNRSLLAAIVLFVVSVIYTVLVSVVDKAAIGPNETVVGFSKVNGAFRDLIGFNEIWDKITDCFMALAILVALSFAVIGVVQLVKRKSIMKVDKAVIGLAVVYVVIVILYVFFDKVPLNYRPFIPVDEVELEASFPSSHTLVICTVLATAFYAWGKVFANKKTVGILRIAATAVIILGTVGRMLAGVHWLTDIVAGVLFSATISACYIAVIDKIEEV